MVALSLVAVVKALRYLLSRAGVHAFDDRLDDWRAARAFALGYERAASRSS